MDFDSILELVDDFGTYQRLMLAFVLLPGFIPCGFHAYNQLFLAATPSHWCRVLALENTAWNFTQDQIKSLRFHLNLNLH
jgi:OCT family organic cation transporter-like MFS transporter 4/5